MALLLGNSNLGPLLDLLSPRPDRKPRLSGAVDLSHKRDAVPVSLSSKNFDSEPDFRNPRIGRRRPSSKTNAVDFDSDDNNGYEDEEGEEGGTDEWEKEMRRRLKEIEEMKELEKQAEELQSRINDAEGDGGEEETEEEKKARVRKELEKLAKEQAERRETAKVMFDLGQKAYGRGMYGRAIEFLEAALTIIPGPTLLGGEIQIWLAMAYEANNRHSDCIALYQQLERKHPIASIRRQAADLRYILQAPKLKISQDEMVTIPLIGSSYDSYAANWTDKYKDKDKRRSGYTTNQLPSNKDYLADFLVWRPPKDWEKDKAFWVSMALWLTLFSTEWFLAFVMHSFVKSTICTFQFT
ncbi:hypothetical protein H6P81_012630 [Aristolochia fimbriata]|uniref:Uncharacterized protein n=1 Tax=Aristolochia fimbriata TaxID=158543 RepID=A0AAV7EG03_ARIFI|nr:hypothetical protein H6P81_012630 [Aristolochia fimbriata]